MAAKVAEREAYEAEAPRVPRGGVGSLLGGKVPKLLLSSEQEIALGVGAGLGSVGKSDHGVLVIF